MATKPIIANFSAELAFTTEFETTRSKCMKQFLPNYYDSGMSAAVVKSSRAACAKVTGLASR